MLPRLSPFRAQHENHTLLHVAYCLRFNPGIRFLKENLARIGHPVAADAECYSWLPAWRPGRDHTAGYSASVVDGGVLLDLSHELDLLNFLLGPGRCLNATIETGRVLNLSSSVDETASLTTRHGNVVATVRISFARRPESRVLRIFGQDGTLEWDAIGRHARFESFHGEPTETITWVDPAAMYTLQARAWLESISFGTVGDLATGEDGVLALRIVDLAREIAEVLT